MFLNFVLDQYIGTYKRNSLAHKICDIVHEDLEMYYGAIYLIASYDLLFYVNHYFMIYVCN
jgi:hypothetical protein